MKRNKGICLSWGRSRLYATSNTINYQGWHLIAQFFCCCSAIIFDTIQDRSQFAPCRLVRFICMAVSNLYFYFFVRWQKVCKHFLSFYKSFHGKIINKKMKLQS